VGVGTVRPTKKGFLAGPVPSSGSLASRPRRGRGRSGEDSSSRPRDLPRRRKAHGTQPSRFPLRGRDRHPGNRPQPRSNLCRRGRRLVRGPGIPRRVRSFRRIWRRGAARSWVRPGNDIRLCGPGGAASSARDGTGKSSGRTSRDLVRHHEIRGELLRPSVETGVRFRKRSHCNRLERRNLEKVVAGGGIEPPTRGFSVLCSTN
jgi:hypothetical protein